MSIYLKLIIESGIYIRICNDLNVEHYIYIERRVNADRNRIAYCYIYIRRESTLSFMPLS